MSDKRPSTEIPPETLARAIEMRRAGRTYRAIAAELGISRSAIHERLRALPEEPAGAPAAEAAERLELAADLDDLAQSALLSGRAVVRQLAGRLGATRCAACGVGGEQFSAGDAERLVSISERAVRLAAALRARGTAQPEAGTTHTILEATALAALRVIVAPAPPAPPPAPAGA